MFSKVVVSKLDRLARKLRLLLEMEEGPPQQREITLRERLIA